MKQQKGTTIAVENDTGNAGGPPDQVEITGDPTSAEREEIALLAYSYWEARGFQGGSPEDDWLRAEREVHERRPAVRAASAESA